MLYRFGDFELDADRFELRRDGHKLEIQPKALNLLAYLLQHAERTPSKQELLEELWPEVAVAETSLSRAIRGVRRALGELASDQGILRTIRGRGYRIGVSVEVIDPTAPVAEPVPPINRLTGSVFVGRELQLEELRSGLDEAISGRPHILMLVGEPGIGKTRTAEELGLYAEKQGALLLWGRCYEGEGAPAYWPWIQVLRSYVHNTDSETLHSEMGTAAAAAIAAVVPELRERLSTLPEPQSLEPTEARFRLFEGIAAFLRKASMRLPIAIVLDDLHWADTASLLLLKFLAAELGQSRMLILGTYRDTELGRKHPLAATLAELARNRQSERVLLRGLSQEDVARFIEQTSNAEPNSKLVEAVYRETEGNPFFVHEFVRLLAADGRLGPGHDFDSWTLGIPQGVREVVSHRLDLLSEACNKALQAGAVLGRNFDPHVLQQVADLSEEELTNALEEALIARMIESDTEIGERYRFSHALVRETLYDEISAPHRVRFHQRAGEALEKLHAGRPGPHLMEIANHFFRSLQIGHAERAVDSAVCAGHWAESQHAYEDAASQYRRAAEAIEFESAPDERRLCELLVELGRLENYAGDRTAVVQSGMRALELARRLGASELFARAVFGLYAIEGMVEMGTSDETAVELLEEALERLAPEDTPLRARLLSALALQLNFFEQPEQSVRRQLIRNEARAIATRLGDAALLFDVTSGQVEGGGSSSISRDGSIDDLLPFGEESVGLAEEMGERAQFLAYGIRGTVRLISADMAGMRADFQAAERLAEVPRTARTLAVAVRLRCVRAVLAGRLDEGKRLAREARTIGRRSFGARADRHYEIQMNPISLHLGTLRSNPALVERANRENCFGLILASVARALMAEGAREDAARCFERLATRDFEAVPGGLARVNTLCLGADVCAYLGDKRRAKSLYELMYPYARYHAVIGSPVAEAYLGSFAMRLGMLATLLGRYADAEDHFVSAIDWADAAGARPWLAHTRVGYVRMLVARGESSDAQTAREQLRAAVEPAREMGMQGLIREANALEAEAFPRH